MNVSRICPTSGTVCRAPVFALLVAATACPAKESVPPSGQPHVAPLPVVRWSDTESERWKEVERLMDEQKYEAASERVGELLAAAREADQPDEVVRSLVRWTQLRMALHGWEAAVKHLREQAWPGDLLSQSVLNLYYGATLVTYAHGYAWEIGQRERIDTRGEVDLAAWTMEQIYAEAQQAYRTVWDHRDQLGSMPRSAVQQYLTPNTFPDGIRPTLRDAATYLWVQLLQDTQGWRPEQSNALYRLDMASLLGDNPLGPIDLAAGAVHPLTKLAAVLDDLEQWHAQRGDAGAALEARLVRLQAMHDSFAGPADRARIRVALTARLQSARSDAWWAQGMAVLAEMTRQDDAPDRLVRARGLAEQGQKAYPGTVGGEHCRSIIEQIDQPEYSMQAMAHDSQDRRSLAVDYRNLTRIFFRAYARDLVELLDAPTDQIFPTYDRLEQLVRGDPDFEWSVSLPKTTDFETHRQYVTPPMTAPGYHVIIASAREDFGPDNNVLHGANFIVTDLVLITHDWGPDAGVTVLSANSGAPVPGARVSLYSYDWRDRRRRVLSKTTDRNGEARVTAKGAAGYFLLAEKDSQLALDPNALAFYRPPEQGAETATLVFTDRSIYRPEQKILWKVVAFRGRHDQGHFRTLPKAKLKVRLRDANWQQVAEASVTTNAHGTAAGELTIPAGRLLGQWTVETSLGGRANVRVEEYKRPTFEAKLLDAEQPLRLNEPATLKGEARYYFGLPVASGSVRWRVRRAPVYPWWWSWYGWYGRRRTAQQVVATGSSALEPDGSFSIAFTPEADERDSADSGVSYNYAVSADVTDEGGETRTASRTFRLGFVAVNGNIVVDRGFYPAGESFAVDIRRTNLDGAPAPGKGSFRLLAVTQPAQTALPADEPVALPPGEREDGRLRTPGDLLRPRWEPSYNADASMRGWPDGRVQLTGELTHDAKGSASASLPALPPGAYRLRYETRDAFGATFSTSRELVVAGPRTDLALPGALLVEQSSVRVGGMARVVVASGLADQALFFEIHRGGQRREIRRLRSGTETNLIELPITEADRGGFGVVLWLQRDHQLVVASSQVYVPWDNKQLEVEIGSFRDLLRPGAKETWTVEVKAAAGNESAVAGAEVLAYMYDRSLDFFAPHTPPAPLSLYPTLTYAVMPRGSDRLAPPAYLSSNGFVSPFVFSPPSPDSLQLFSDYAIGGPGVRGYGVLGALGRGGSGIALGGKRHGMPARRLLFKAGEVAAMDALEGGTGLERKSEKSADKRARRAQAPPEPTGSATTTAAPTEPMPEVRADFSETAFWKPQLLTGKDGSVRLTFEVPDSVTSWSVWAHAITDDLRSGSVQREARTVKELMVRPYLPRFLREGDEARLRVVINNAAEHDLDGELTFDIIDPRDEQSLLGSFGLSPDQAALPFHAAKGGSATLSFPVKTPSELLLVAFKVVARAKGFSDGELRPLPVLPGRMHLAQSRFVTLREESRREMTFDDLARDDDPTRVQEQLVVTVDAQLFYAVLQALPYLVKYPYECTEQTLNRFLSTGIVSSLYDHYPAIGRMARQMSQRPTQLERWDQPDPNRRMALEEAPWLQLAKGGSAETDGLINVLNPSIARAQRETSLSKLRKAQTASGGFPWFPGGPPSPWMTLYLLHGFSKAMEFGVEVPRDMIQRAWGYMHQHYATTWVRDCMARDSCWESITFLSYVLSNYPDLSWTGDIFTKKERETMLAFSFEHWKDHSPFLKGYLSLTLWRTGRKRDARLVWESVMDSAKSEKDQGTFWAPEDRSWLWYNDTIETHAFAIRTLMELSPKEPKLDGLVLWLFLNKKLNHWKSTRATAEVIYALAKYLESTGELGAREQAKITIGSDVHEMVFAPDRYTGKKNQIVIPGAQLDPKTQSTVVVEKATKGFLLASATWHFSTERLPKEARGDTLSVTRQLFRRDTSGREATLVPLTDGAEIAVGDELEIHLSITAKHPMEYVHLRDPRGAGFEPTSNVSRHKWDLGIYWYEEIRDSGTNFFLEHLPQGEYTFKYRVRAAVAGAFKLAPAIIQPLYAPELVAYSGGRVVEIESDAK